MNTTWKRTRSWAIIISCCILLLGTAMLIWPVISAVTVCMVLGILCISFGIIEIIRYFKLGLAGIFFRYDLMLAICNILIGLLLLIHPAGAVTFLPIAVAIYMIMGGIFDIQLAVELKNLEGKEWGWVMTLGIIDILFAFVLLLNPFVSAYALTITAGIALIVAAIQSIYLIICISKAIKSGKNGKVIATEWTED